MIDKIILSAMLGTVGFNGLFPEWVCAVVHKQLGFLFRVSQYCEYFLICSYYYAFPCFHFISPKVVYVNSVSG